MKASAFAYARATSLDSALKMLSAHREQAKLLAGGQSLLPAMNLRLISPEVIIDISELAELRGIASDGGVLKIGALTRHVDVARSPEIAASAPLLAEAVKHVAHPAVLNRGTIGGSLAHADPAAELPACMLALDATLVLRGQDGERRVAAGDFFKGIYTTALAADELLVAVELPVAQRNSVHFFQEFARRHGDFALAGIAALATVERPVISSLRMAFFGVGDQPVLARAATRFVNGNLTPSLIADAAAAFGEELHPFEDQEASSSMRRHLAKVLFMRCAEALAGMLNGAAR